MMKHLASSLAVLPLLPPVWLHHHPDACTLGDLGASQSDRGRTFPRACTSRAVAVQLIQLQPSTLGIRCFDCCSAKMTLVATHQLLMCRRHIFSSRVNSSTFYTSTSRLTVGLDHCPVDSDSFKCSTSYTTSFDSSTHQIKLKTMMTNQNTLIQSVRFNRWRADMAGGWK